MFHNTAITKAQLLYVFEGLSRLVVWLEGFLEGFNEIFVSPPVWFVGLRFFAFFNLRLDELLFPDSSISICQIGQDEGYLLFVVVVYELVYFEVNINILHEQDEIASFPSEGFWWVKLDIFRGFQCRGCNSFGHRFFISVGIVCIKVSFLSVEVSDGVKVSVSVSRCQVSSSQSLEVSVDQGFVVLGCWGAL
jgi:hypothetical protein